MSAEDIAKYAAMLAKNPGNDLARFSLGMAFYDDGKYSEATEHFRLCVQSKPDWMVPTILLGRCAIQTGDGAGARAWLEKARELAVQQRHDGPLEEVNALLTSL